MIWHIKVHFWEYLVIRLFPKAGPNTQLRFEQGTFWFCSWHAIPLYYSLYLGHDQWIWRNLLVALCYPGGEVCLGRLGVGGNYEKIQYYIEWFSKNWETYAKMDTKKLKLGTTCSQSFFLTLYPCLGSFKDISEPILGYILLFWAISFYFLGIFFYFYFFPSISFSIFS